MLEVAHLTRRYGAITAVDDVSFAIGPGDLIGFVGGNGAGKTTTMRIIMGLLAPDAGTVSWHRHPATFDDRATFGYMPEERGLYPKQPIIDQLIYLARLKDMGPADARAEAMGLLERFGLADRARDKLEKLSLGNQQRVQIAAAVMAAPAALILDEPFSGLDPSAVDQMAELLRSRTTIGVPVLFSSHQLDLVERLCDGLVILSRGKVVAQGTREELLATGTVRHRLVGSVDAGWVRGIRGVRVDDVDGPVAMLELLEPGAGRAILQEGLRRGEVYELTRIRPSLSEVYREVTA